MEKQVICLDTSVLIDYFRNNSETSRVTIRIERELRRKNKTINYAYKG